MLNAPLQLPVAAYAATHAAFAGALPPGYHAIPQSMNEFFNLK